MMKNVLSTGMLMLAAVMLVGCENAPQSDASRDALNDQTNLAIKQMVAEDAGLQRMIDNSYGYAIFPSVGKGAFVVGGAYGKGQVYERGKLIGYSELQQGDVGFQAGGKTFSELIIFESRQSMDRFLAGNFQFGADVSAIVIKTGASGNAHFNNGILVFTLPQGGLMFEAAVKGQKFGYQPLGSSPATRPTGGY